MNSNNESQELAAKKNVYQRISFLVEQESQKVRVFISELKDRLETLKVEEERIEKVSVTLLKKHTSSLPFEEKRIPSAEETLKIQNLRKEVWKSEETIDSDSKNGFQNTLKMFQELQYAQYDPDYKEHEEITRLKQANLCIKKKIETLQAYIEKATTNEEAVQQDACCQLYQATQDTLKKINELDNDIMSVASILSGTGKSFPRSKDVSVDISGKSIKEIFQSTLDQIVPDSRHNLSESSVQIETRNLDEIVKK